MISRTVLKQQVARLWDAQSKNTEYKYELRGHEHVIECAVFAPVSAYPLLSDMAQTPKLVYILRGLLINVLEN
jgi:hypothetical protein